MIEKVIKYISAFFLWLAFLVIIAHSIIPHGHSSADTFTSREDACTDSGGNTNHNSGFPFHCHAFNDFASEKVLKFILTKDIQFSDISVNIFSDVYKFQVRCIAISDLRTTFIDSPFLKSTALRGPPLSS